MTDRRNFIAGVASSGWTALLSLAVMPWYLKYLGVEAYGMIGIHLTLQGLFALLDMGFAPAVSREVARACARGDRDQARKVVHSMAVIFVMVGALASGLIALTSPWLAGAWLNPGSLPIGTVATALALSALAIGARWPGTLYIGVLTGVQRIDLASGVTIASTTLTNLGAVAILAFVSPTLHAFFLWYLFIGALHSIAMAFFAWRALGGRRSNRFDWATIRRIWRFTAGMATVAALGAMIMQLDKVILAAKSSLEQVAHYTIAFAVAGILYRITLPAYNVLYPKLIKLFEERDIAGVAATLRHDTQLYLTLILPAAMGMAVCAKPILSIWLGSPEVVSQTAPLVTLLALGTALHCIMFFPFAAQVASGNTRIPVALNATLAIIFVPLLFVMIGRYQAEGAAIAWVIVHTVYFCLGTYVTDRFLLPGEGRDWLLRGVAPPFMTSALFGAVAAALISLVASHIVQIAIGSVFAAAALVAGASALPEYRAMLRLATAKLRGM